MELLRRVLFSRGWFADKLGVNRHKHKFIQAACAWDGDSMMACRVLLLVVLVILPGHGGEALALSADGQGTTGSITGTVATSAGTVLRDADLLIRGTTEMSPDRRGRADESGHFAIHGLRFGDYVIYAYKTEEGYWPATNAFLSESPTRFSISSSHPNAVIAVSTEPKVAKLKGSVVDATTKAPIPGVEIWLCRSNDTRAAGTFLADADGKYEHVVPSRVAVQVYVAHAGFAPLVVDALNLAPSEVRELDLKLRPATGKIVSAPHHCHFP